MRLRVSIEPQLGASHEQIARFAQAAEAAGFDGFFRSDHYLMNYGTGPLPPGGSDAWLTLAALARETRTIRLGTMVTPVTFRHPGPLAVAVAQVDAMSGGRLELGIGAGWFEREHRAMGIPFPPAAERSERLEEMLEVLETWWATPWGQTFTYVGKHMQLVDSPALPKPLQGRVPVILGGWGERRTPRIAARFADEFNLAFGSLDASSAQFGRVRAACEDLGRDPASMRWSTELTVCCGESVAEAERRAIAARWEPERMRTVPGRFIGSPGELLDRLAEHRAVGVDTVYFQLIDLTDVDQLALLGERVVPAAVEIV